MNRVSRRGFFGLVGKIMALGAAMRVSPSLLEAVPKTISGGEGLWLVAWGKDRIIGIFPKAK